MVDTAGNNEENETDNANTLEEGDACHLDVLDGEGYDPDGICRGVLLGCLDLQECAGSAPKVEEWKDVPMDHVGVHLSGAVESMWRQAQKEIEFMRRGFYRVFGSRSPNLTAIVDYLLGPQSIFFRVFSDCLGWSSVDFSGWMQAFLVASAYKLTTEQMYMDEGYVKFDNLIPKNKYIQMWSDVSTACLSKDENERPSGAQESLWMKVEDALNGILREVSVKSLTMSDNGESIDKIKIV